MLPMLPDRLKVVKGEAKTHRKIYIINMILIVLHQSQNRALSMYTRTKKYSSLHHLQCISVTVLSRVAPIGELVHTTVQQRPLQTDSYARYLGD